MTFKRFYLACLMGILAGVVCVLLSKSQGILTLKEVAFIFTSRALIGFVIGISAVRIGWALHGFLMGLVVSIPSGFFMMMDPPDQFGKWGMLALWIVAGGIYGFLIELITSGIFKAKFQR